MKEIKVPSRIFYLFDLDVVRGMVPPFSCYSKDNYTMKYTQLIEPLSPIVSFPNIGVLNIY